MDLNILIKLQNVDGSYDQAFPNEKSYAATAFILNSMLSTMEIVNNLLSPNLKKKVLTCIKKSALFLYSSKENHGVISNHIAGSALALLKCSILFNDELLKKKI